MPGKFYLIPTPLAEDAVRTIPGYIAPILAGLRTFIVENERFGRRALKQVCPDIPIQECVLFVLNPDDPGNGVRHFLDQNTGKDIGLLSDAGSPCVADPGAEAVLAAHRKGMEVIPLAGPSSIVLALMASGLNGQKFSFHGYLSKDKDERSKQLKDLEARSQQEDQTQIFMETPYHNQTLFAEILMILNPETLVCVAADLTSSRELIKTMPVGKWRDVPAPDLSKRPALFLIQHGVAHRFPNPRMRHGKN